MNILFISALEIKGKGAQSIRMTLEGYVKAGHTVTLLTTKKPHSKDYFYEEEYTPKEDNFRIIRVWLPLGRLAKYSGKINRIRELYLFTLVAFFWGVWQVATKKPDVIYGYEVRGIIPGRALATVFHKKFIARYQGTLMEPIIKNKKNDHRAWRRVWDHRYALGVPADLYIMTNDGTLGDEVLQYFKIAKEKTCFWMNGVNKSINNPKYQNFLKEKYKIPANAKILITVHRLTYWKRTDRALVALKEVLKKNSKVYLVVIGDGERKVELVKMAKELGVEKNVFFAGGIPNEEVGKYLNGADIYLGTYDLSNAGNPLFESMLSGLAVISLNNGSTADFLGNGKAGILIKDEKEFAPQIIKLIEDEKELTKWKELAKNYSHQKFWTWDERIAREIKEVEALISSSGK